jgi:serine/threonine-protein kinase RsbW
MSLHHSEVIRLDFPARHSYLHMLSEYIAELLRLADGVTDPDLVIYNIQLAAHEACTNIVSHAYADQAAGEGRISIRLALHPEPLRFEMEIQDTGRSFDLKSVPNPNLTQPQIHRYGLFLIHSLMDDVIYQPENNSNRWRLVKKLYAERA